MINMSVSKRVVSADLRYVPQQLCPCHRSVLFTGVFAHPDWYYVSLFFGDIARLADNVPACLTVRCQIDASLGHLSSKNWKRHPGHPTNRWLDLVRQDSNCSPAALWGRAVLCGHGARSTPEMLVGHSF